MAVAALIAMLSESLKALEETIDTAPELNAVANAAGEFVKRFWGGRT